MQEQTWRNTMGDCPMWKGWMDGSVLEQSSSQRGSNRNTHTHTHRPIKWQVDGCCWRWELLEWLHSRLCVCLRREQVAMLIKKKKLPPNKKRRLFHENSCRPLCLCALARFLCLFFKLITAKAWGGLWQGMKHENRAQCWMRWELEREVVPRGAPPQITPHFPHLDTQFLRLTEVLATIMCYPILPLWITQVNLDKHMG